MHTDELLPVRRRGLRDGAALPHRPWMTDECLHGVQLPPRFRAAAQLRDPRRCRQDLRMRRRCLRQEAKGTGEAEMTQSLVSRKLGGFCCRSERAAHKAKAGGEKEHLRWGAKSRVCSPYALFSASVLTGTATLSLTVGSGMCLLLWAGVKRGVHAVCPSWWEQPVQMHTCATCDQHTFS